MRLNQKRKRLLYIYSPILDRKLFKAPPLLSYSRNSDENSVGHQMQGQADSLQECQKNRSNVNILFFLRKVPISIKYSQYH